MAMRDRLKLSAGDNEVLAARLSMPLTLVHVENADTFEAGGLAGALATLLPGCALVVSGRFRGLGAGAGWREVSVAPFDEPTALDQMRAELGSGAPGQESWPALVAALGFLPLALHLAAGHLCADHRADAFLRRLRSKNLALTGTDPADPSFRERSRALLSDTFELSLGALRRDGGADGEQWLAAFSALGHAPAIGFGESFGAAISGLCAEAFEDMVLAASRLCLLDRVPRGTGSAFRLHPLLAELIRSRADKDATSTRVTEWFVARLPERGDDQGQRWRDLHQEIAALIHWLKQVPAADRVRVERAASGYAMLNGPYHAWLMFLEEVLAADIDDEERSRTLWTLGNVALLGGFLERALTAAKEKHSLDLKRGAVRDSVAALGLVCDIIQARGDLDGALRYRREAELPMYERLGDVRSAALSKGKIADIMQTRGDLDGALRIRREEELPVYEQLGDVRSAAMAKGQIADIMLARGDLDGAMLIYQEVLPALERLEDVPMAAVAKGKMADIMQARHDLDGALHVLREEVLPAFERLGDVHQAAVTRGRIADILQARGDLDGALRIREEELAVYKRLGLARDLLIGRAELAITRLRRGREGDRDEAQRLLYTALNEARRRRLPAEVQNIAWTIEKEGLRRNRASRRRQDRSARK